MAIYIHSVAEEIVKFRLTIKDLYILCIYWKLPLYNLRLNNILIYSGFNSIIIGLS